MIFKVLLLAFTLNMPSHADTAKLWLEVHGCPCAEGFSSVSLVETGRGLYGVGIINNPFGMMARPGYPQSYGYTRYVDDLMAVWDLRKWVNKSPPQEAESFVLFLLRRNWNTRPEYFLTLLLLPGAKEICQKP